LGHAMDCAEAEDQVATGNGDDLAIGEKFGEGGERDAIVWIAEGGDEDDAIGDVEIGVAGGETLSGEEDGFGHGEGFDAQGLAGFIFHLLEEREIFLERGVIGFGWIWFDDRDNRGRVDEAGEIVDVAVGIVAGDTVAEPENVGGTEIIAQDIFDFGAGHPGIARLDRAEEALFGGEQGAAAIHVNAAAFEDYALGRCLRMPPRFSFGRGARFPHRFWLPEGQFQAVVGVGDEGGVFLIIVILGPGIEFPVGDGDFAGGIFYEDGAGIAGPSAICRDAGKFYGGKIGAGIFQDVARGRFGVLSFDEDSHAFDPREMAHDFGVDPGDRREFAGPIGALVRPAEPCGFVRFPFGGHAEAEGVGRGAGISGKSHANRGRIIRARNSE
jgi:hypothetical protein